MEVWQNIGNWSPGIAFGMACLWFFNFIVTKFLEEKAEWNKTIERLLDRYDTRLVDNTTALVDARNQDHNLRSDIQKFATGNENNWRTVMDLLRQIDNRGRGGGGSSDD